MKTLYRMLAAGVLALALALALTCTSPHLARAQSCCGVAGEDELSVAGFDRRAVLTSKLAVEHMLGSHDSRGDYHALADGVSATDAILVLGAGLRMPFYEPLQVHGSVPMRLQYRALPTGAGASGSDSAVRVGFGDASAFVRWSALRDDERGLFDELSTWAPSLDLFVGAKSNTGVYSETVNVRSLARTTGDDTWAMIGGVRAIKYITPVHALRLSLRYDHHFIRDTSPVLSGYSAFSPGDVVSLTVGYLGLFGMHWAYGVTVDASFTGAASARPTGQDALQGLPDSEMREVSIGAHLTHVLVMPDLDLTLGVSYTPPIDGLSRNVSWEGLLAGLTLRWHFMNPDG